jgi:hypothetical protein
MPQPYELPEDIKALSADDLQSNITTATEAFRELMESEDLTDADLPKLEALRDGITALRAEETERESAAEAARARLAELSAEVLGESTGEAEGSEGAETEEQAEEQAEAEAVAASASRAPALRLNRVKKTAPAVTASASITVAETPRMEIKAAADIPGHRAGARMELADVVPGMVARAQSLASSGGNSGLVASYSHPFPDELIVTDLGNADQGSAASQYAANQRRLKGGNLVAAGGWCAPSETMYDFMDLACPDMLWDAPEIQLRRGGLRFFPTPTLDVAAMTFLHTEAADIAGTPKPCYTIPCPDPVEVRCDAVGICVRAGLLTQRHFPELIESQLGLVMTAQEIRLRQVLLNQLAAGATAVTAPARFGTVGVLFNAIALHAADLIERFSLCDSVSLEVVLPWWSKNMMLADMALRNGVSVDEVTTADIQALFSPLGVRIQWARGILDVPFPQDNDPANNEIGGTTPAADWPDNLQFLIYPAGQVQIGRGAEINLGVVYDHASLQQNLATFAFAEECVALVNRAPAGATRLVTVPICASGTTGGQTLVTCA